MKHLSTINKEFVKHAAKWDDLSYKAQKDYIMEHPGTKRRVTAPITDIHSWAETKKFMNLETGKQSSFSELPQKQQDALKARFEEDKKKHGESIQQQKEIDDNTPKEKLNKYTIMGSTGEGDVIKAKTPEEAMIKYLVKHEEYSEERAKQEVQSLKSEEKDGITTYGNWEIKPITKNKKDKKNKRGSHPEHPEATYDSKLSDATTAGFSDVNGEQYHIKRSELPADHPQHTDNFSENQGKKERKKYSERKVKRLARRIRRDMKAAGKYDEGDDFTLEIAKKFVEDNQKLKDYFKDKGIDEKDMGAAFAEYI